MNVSEQIKQYITAHGDMPFVDFMRQTLYSPEFGYYTFTLPKIGLEGDFITAPELTPLYGHALAKQCTEVLKQCPHPVVLEFGAGTGRLCVDVLSALESAGNLPETYYILDVSGFLREKQRVTIEESIPHLAHLVTWLDGLPTQSFSGVIIANEVLDAMPVHRFRLEQTGIMESFVIINENNQLEEIFKPTDDQALIDYVSDHLNDVRRPYTSEVNLWLPEWIKACANLLDKGVMLIIDYGFPRHEYYHSDRSNGTIMCHHHHQSHPNPLFNPGEEDITAHVDFTHVAECAMASGFHVAGFASQAAFLLANGILDELQSIELEKDRLKTNTAVKLLLQEHEMGELFKVMALAVDFDSELSGFSLQDRRARL